MNENEENNHEKPEEGWTVANRLKVTVFHGQAASVARRSCLFAH